jgi:tRNA U54 and U55 pseudouridine synthase Pus10
MRTRYDFENCDALCYGCHQYFETHKATEYREWKIKKMGEEAFNRLLVRSRLIKQWTPQEKEELKKALQEELKGYKSYGQKEIM